MSQGRPQGAQGASLHWRSGRPRGSPIGRERLAVVPVECARAASRGLLVGSMSLCADHPAMVAPQPGASVGSRPAAATVFAEVGALRD